MASRCAAFIRRGTDGAATSQHLLVVRSQSGCNRAISCAAAAHSFSPLPAELQPLNLAAGKEQTRHILCCVGISCAAAPADPVGESKEYAPPKIKNDRHRCPPLQSPPPARSPHLPDPARAPPKRRRVPFHHNPPPTIPRLLSASCLLPSSTRAIEASAQATDVACAVQAG